MLNENSDQVEKILLEKTRAALTIIEGKEYHYFGGTSYYELHNNEKVLEAAIDAIKKYGITSSSSRSSYGTTQLIIDLENEAAKYFATDDAVYLSSGFLSDAAAIQVLNQENKFDIIFIDENAHYSNQFAAKLTGKPIINFPHLNHDELEKLIENNCNEKFKPLIMTDGIFPIYGSIAPIDKYLSIVKKYDGIIWIDDAHAFGVLGENGKGTNEHFKLNSNKIFFGGTFSKAFGGFGGIIPGEKKFIKQIKNSSLQNGTTPAPSSAIAASLIGMKLLKSNPQLKNKLWQNAIYLKTQLKKIGIETNETHVPIAAWKLKSKSEMEKVQKELLRKNIIIQYINYVGSGEDGVLRIVVFSTHTFEQIDYLVDSLKSIL
jgi:7-keto-8-aminopelargonate synthetase-like enzyme